MGDIYFLRQFFILTGGLMASLSSGFMLAFPVVLNSAIVSNDSDIKTTSDHVSWIAASSGISGILGAIIISPVLTIFGRKAVHIVINFIQFIGWVIFPFANSVIALYAARMVQGVSIGAIYINSIVICEYVHPRRRGYFVTLKKVGVAVGSLFCHAMEPYFTWRQIAIFAAVFTLMAVILTLFWPESPSFLAQNGKIVECEKSFEWLNGCSDESQKYLKDLIEAHTKNTGRKRKISFIQILRKFCERDFQKSIAIVSILTVVLDLCGRYYFVAYAIQIMMKLLDNKTSALYFTLGADLLTVIALSTSTLLIGYFKRRTLIFIFGIFTVLLMFTVSILVYLNTILKFPTEVLWFIALIIIFLCFFVNVGVVPVSFAMIGEIFPLEHKGLGSMMAGIIFTILFGLTLKLTPVLIIHTGLYGTYAIYGVSLGLCLVILYKILPETKDKTLQEIGDELKGIQNQELRRERSALVNNS